MRSYWLVFCLMTELNLVIVNKILHLVYLHYKGWNILNFIRFSFRLFFSELLIELSSNTNLSLFDQFHRYTYTRNLVVAVYTWRSCSSCRRRQNHKLSITWICGCEAITTGVGCRCPCSSISWRLNSNSIRIHSLIIFNVIP